MPVSRPQVMSLLRVCIWPSQACSGECTPLRMLDGLTLLVP